jgi:hypothetical protein
MKLIAFPITKEKLNKINITIALSIVLLLLLIGGYVLLKWTGKLGKLSLGDYFQKLAAGIVTVTQRSKGPKQDEVSPEELKITLPKSGDRTYEEVAQQGEGITHLARRALKEYLQNTGQGADLTPEHKVYIEDYIQKKTGDRWLNLGEKISFSEELIKEAIEKSRQLTGEQLENLKQYSTLISSF